jgi:uncharacterized membrane protein YdjX (TVP38/TMEM64 family)
MDDLQYSSLPEDAAGGGSPRGRLLARWLPLAGALAGLLVAYALGLHDYLSLEALRRSDADISVFVADHRLMAALLYAVIYIAAVAVSFPGASFLTIAGGYLFGAAFGTALALVSATIGATLIFLIARTSLGSLLADRAGPRMQRLRAGIQRDGFFYLLFLRLAPIFPFWLVNLAAALFGMRLPAYVLATAIGVLPGTFVFSYFGQGLRSALGSEGSPVTVGLFVAFALLALMALIPVLVRRWLRDRKEEGASS